MKTILSLDNKIHVLFFLFLTTQLNAQWQAGLAPTDFNFVKQTFSGSQTNDVIADGVAYEYNLTPFDPALAATIGQNNAMWNKNVLNMRRPFSICFQFRVVSNSGGFAPTNIRKLDGFALMLQRLDGIAAPGPPYTPSAAELSRINTGWGGSSLAAQCNGALAKQLILEFDFYANSNPIDGCPSPACDANDSGIEEHVSINGETGCTWDQASGSGFLMTPVAMKAGIGNYDGNYGPAGSTCRGNGVHNVTFTWTPNTPGTGAAQDVWGTCLASGAYSLGGYTGCLDQIAWNDPGVVCGSPNKVPCYNAQGGTFQLIIDGSTRFTTNVTNVWNIMNPNNRSWDGSIIFGMSAAGYNIPSPDEVFIKFCAPLLPVEFSSFDAVSIPSGTLLNWETSSERNNSHFIIQRSKDGVNFEDIGRVNGSGNSSELVQYKFTDQTIIGGKVYYRLMQVDYDGKSSFSSIEEIDRNIDEEISIYPNPNQGTVTIKLLSSNNSNESYNLNILNSLGQLVLFDQINSKSEKGKVLDLENLPYGVYVVQVTTDKKTLIKKIVKE